MRKIFLLSAIVFLLFSSQSFALEFPKGASPHFFHSPTAYSAQFFDKILQAYNLQYANGEVPFTYASVTDGKASFTPFPMAYTPKQYHQIITSYGAELTAENVREVLWVSSYAKVANDTIVFGNKPTAYGGPEWTNILEAYSMPAEPMAAKPMEKKMEAPPVVAKPGDDDGDGVTNEKDACPDTPQYAAVDERGCWALSSALLFDFDKSVIKTEYYSLLDDTKKVFAEYPKMNVAVEGHADSTGTDEYNQKLSERRAQAVVDYLVNNVGIAASRLKAVGYGESQPAYSNESEEGRAKNRRVQFSPVR